MEVKQVKIKDITPYENNAKIHPDHQIDQIAKSLEMFGWQQPMVISKDGVIVIGHGRFEAAKKLGQKEVPCVIAEDLTDDELRMLRLADNKLNESPWDMDILAEELEGLDFGDLDLDWDFSADVEEPLDLEKEETEGSSVVLTIKIPDVNSWDNVEQELKDIVYSVDGLISVKMV